MSVVYQYQDQGSNSYGDDHFKKKLIFVVALLAAALVIIALVAVFATSKNVKKTSGNDINEENALAFTKAVHNKDSDAITRLSIFDPGLSDNEVIENGDPLEELRARFNLDSCVSPVAINETTVEVTCEDTVQEIQDSKEKYTSKLSLTFNQEAKVSDISYGSQAGEEQ